MIRIEVQQEPNAELVAFELEGPWDTQAVLQVALEIEKVVESSDHLGVSLWDVMSKRLSPEELDFQLMSRPKGHRCATIPVRFAALPSNPTA